MHFFKRLNDYFLTHHARYVHAIKYTVAFSLGYLAMLGFKDQYSFWILVTIAVVMSGQPVVGQLLQKSVLRIVGTVVGLLFGMFTFFIPQSAILLFLMVTFVAFFMAYQFAFRSEEVGQIGVLGMVTFALVAFLAQDSVHFALMRLLDTFIGILISFFVSLFIFPMTSRRMMMLTLSGACRDLHRFIEKVFVEGVDRRRDPTANPLENSVIQGLAKVRTVIRSGKYEVLWSSPAHKKELDNLIRYLRAVFHYLLFVDVAISEISDKNPNVAAQTRAALLPTAKKLSQIFSQAALDKPSFSRRLYYRQLDEQAYSDGYKSQFFAIDFALRRIPYCLRKMEIARRMLQL